MLVTLPTGDKLIGFDNFGSGSSRPPERSAAQIRSCRPWKTGGRLVKRPVSSWAFVCLPSPIGSSPWHKYQVVSRRGACFFGWTRSVNTYLSRDRCFLFTFLPFLSRPAGLFLSCRVFRFVSSRLPSSCDTRLPTPASPTSPVEQRSPPATTYRPPSGAERLIR
ncbi:hypothetical protein B0T16DRAFT_413569 [Cercophora newfieldiana]|uniref:Uncharacterized protein n=1 Tax=Cercophora newfieldiana TaxID=92897 RepID=A0AA39Y6W8_9PEZI|nr:hypothetical protein B0T16DRAFT_413569 [Cercophora newfieldiana]